MDKELPWLADNAQLELKYKKRQNTTQSSQMVRANRCLLSLKASFRHWVINCYKKLRRKKNIVWRYENFFTGVAVRHHAGHQLDRRTQTLNPGPDNGGASLYRAKMTANSCSTKSSNKRDWNMRLRW